MFPASSSSAPCTAPSGRRLLFRYTSREATESEQRVFESHILECDLCYEDFLAVWRVGELVESWTESAGVEGDSGNRALSPARLEPSRGSARLSRLRVAIWLAVGMVLGLAASALV